jgi:hypothetical protein
MESVPRLLNLAWRRTERTIAVCERAGETPANAVASVPVLSFALQDVNMLQLLPNGE